MPPERLNVLFVCSRLAAAFGDLLTGRPVHVPDIPDEYRFMDPELVGLLERSVGGVLGLE